MNRLRATLLCVLALTATLLGAQVILAASTVSWEAASTGLPATRDVRDMAFGDVNNDGKPELVVAFSGDAGLAVYGRSGAGLWATTGLTTGLPITGSYQRLALGDINFDGNLDIFASRQGSAGYTILIGNGAGSWNPNVYPGQNSGAYRGVALADNRSSNLLGMFIAMDANGIQIVPDISVTTTGTYQEIAAGFVSEDAYVDVAATDDSGGIEFWKGAPGSTWVRASRGLPRSPVFRGLALGDVDNDGQAELVASQGFVLGAGGGILIYEWREASGDWALAANQIPGTTAYGQLKLGDVNNDGWLDVMASSYQSLPNSSTGLFTWLGGPSGFAAGSRPTTTGNLRTLALADFDLDGLLDAASGEYTAGHTFAWRNSGVQTILDAWMELPSPRDTGSLQSVAHGDLDGDGRLDVVLSGAAGGLEGWLGDGGNGWTSCPGLAKAVGSGAYGDILMDVFPQIGQDPTVIAARTDNGGITFIHGGTCSGGGGASSITASGSFGGLSAGDIYHDGNLAVVAARAMSGGGLRLWENTGSGWTAPTSLASGATISDTALGDVDHDGVLEIAAADSSGGGVSIYNYSAGVWGKNAVIATGEYYAVGLGDINNDGDLDIVAAQNGAGKGIDVWLGQGSASAWSLQAGPDATNPLTYYALDLADFNHDGKLDILAAGDDSGLMLWAGNGEGKDPASWTRANTGLPGGGVFYSSSFGHIDHDGNLDLLATEAGKGLRLWTAADGAPPTITPFRPSLWISATQSPTLTAHVLDAGAGISTTSGQYRYSKDAGATWSGWFAAPISGADGSTVQQTLTTPPVSFNQDSNAVSHDLNKIEFRAADMAGNWASTDPSAIWIDTVPPVPTSLFSYEREAGTWSTDRYITVTLGASDATSGWLDSDTLFDQAPDTLPPAVANVAGIHYWAGPLADGSWYAHTRPHDEAGNWGAAIHFGALGIDTTPPLNPTFLGSDHVEGVWSGNPSIYMHWLNATDAGSGVHGYSYVMDNSPSTLPDAITETLATAVTMSRPAGLYYFHLRTRDNVGNWAAVAVHSGPYLIDTYAPTSSASSPASSSDIHFWVSWSGSDAHSGIASYDIQVRDKSLGGNWSDWLPAQTGTTAEYTGQGGHIYEFRSRARDNAGNVEAYPTYADTTTAVETIDLFIRTLDGTPGDTPAIEVNQSTQDLNNSVPVFAGKRTWVRCYAQSSVGSFRNVNARLKVYSNDVYQGVVGPINAGATITVTNQPNRYLLNDAFLFDVPASYVKLGVARFECEINYPARKYAENNYANNKASVTLGIGARAGVLNVNMVDVRFQAPDGLHQVRQEDRRRLEAYLEAAYPIQWVNPTYTYLTPYYDSEPTLHDVLSDLDSNVDDVDEALMMHHYGMLFWPGHRFGTIGLGRVSGLVAAGYTAPDPGVGDETWGEETGAHEIGHNLGRLHVHCAGTEDDDGNGSIDILYPYPVTRISPDGFDWDATTVFGIDGSVTPPRIIPPDWGDLMSYCVPQWPSPYTYVSFWAVNPGMSAQAAQTPQGAPVDRLAVFGSVVTPTQIVTLSAFYHVTSATDKPGRDADGTYSIRFFDQDGALLQNYPFSPAWEEYPSMVGGISERPPWAPDTKQIAIWLGETALVTRTVSAHAPTVSMDSPGGGETLNGATVTVEWSADDLDHDPLTYRLDYSRDGGATWQGISPSLHSLTATLDLSILPGTTQGKFRVRASDGVNTTSAATTGVFTVPTKLPEITHMEPVSGTAYVHRQTVTFQGGAYDMDDNVLPDDRLTWTSSLMGTLGTGHMLQRVDLITGTHVITLTATDSQSNTVSASTEITIEQGDEEYAIYLPIVLRQAGGQ